MLSCDGPQKVVDIFRAKRLKFNDRPMIEPSVPVCALYLQEVDENGRAVLADASIRADIREGDLRLTALAKVHYVLNYADDFFNEGPTKDKAIRFMVEIIRDYGEPEGIPLLKQAAVFHARQRSIREAISEAAAMIGREHDYDVIIYNLKKDLDEPGKHLDSLRLFVERYPGSSISVLNAISALASGNPQIEALAGELSLKKH